jgi:hypothetical protein
MADVAVPDRQDTSTAAGGGAGTPAAGGGLGTMRLGGAERALAFVLVVVFLVAVVAMYRLRGDQHWDRLLVVFGALEALVFAGAGALFGTTVQRGNLEVARKDAEAARQDAAQAQAGASAAREEAARHREEARLLAERGTQLADTMRVFAAGQQRAGGAHPGGRPSARPEDLAPAGPPSEMAPLVELANLWFPPRNR